MFRTTLPSHHYLYHFIFFKNIVPLSTRDKKKHDFAPVLLRLPIFYHKSFIILLLKLQISKLTFMDLYFLFNFFCWLQKKALIIIKQIKIVYPLFLGVQLRAHT
jgi:hypothetical protein